MGKNKKTVELWTDFRQMAVGEAVKLQSLAFTGVEAGMFLGGMRMEMAETAALPNGAPFDVLTVRVDRAEAEILTLPTLLAPLGDCRQKTHSMLPSRVPLLSGWLAVLGCSMANHLSWTK